LSLAQLANPFSRATANCAESKSGDPTRHALARPHLCRRAGPIAEGPSPGGGAGQDQGCGGRQGMTSPSFAGGPRCRAKEFVTNDERCVPGGGLSSTADPAAPSSANLLAENGRSRVDAWLISPPWCRATAPVNGRVRPPAFSAGGIAGYLAVRITDRTRVCCTQPPQPRSADGSRRPNCAEGRAAKG